MTLSGFFSQLLQLAIALVLAPLLVGWVNKCRAWLSNRTAPSILLPYRMIRKLFFKDAVVAENASSIFRLTPYIVFGGDVLRSGDRSFACHRPPLRARRRHHRAGRPVRAGARIHGAGGDGHRHLLRFAGRATRDVRRLPGRAGAADGAVHRLADLRIDVAAVDRRHVCAPRTRHLSQPGLRRRCVHDGVAGRECADSGGQPDDASRADDDPRGDAARILGAAPGAAGMGGGAEALQLLVHRPRAVLPVRHRRQRHRLARVARARRPH